MGFTALFVTKDPCVNFVVRLLKGHLTLHSGSWVAKREDQKSRMWEKTAHIKLSRLGQMCINSAEVQEFDTSSPKYPEQLYREIRTYSKCTDKGFPHKDFLSATFNIKLERRHPPHPLLYSNLPGSAFSLEVWVIWFQALFILKTCGSPLECLNTWLWVGMGKWSVSILSKEINKRKRNQDPLGQAKRSRSGHFPEFLIFTSWQTFLCTISRSHCIKWTELKQNKAKPTLFRGLTLWSWGLTFWIYP